MIGWVTVMEPAAYQNWLAGGATGASMAEQGEKLFEQYGCVILPRAGSAGPLPVAAQCVRTSGAARRRPHRLADEAYLRESILNPNAKIVKGYQRDIMPVFQGQISEEGLLQLIVYIKSLSLPTPSTNPVPSATSGGTSNEELIMST